MELFPVYLLFLLVFVNRYVVGLFVKVLQGLKDEEVVREYEPTVTVVVPLYNEGKQIYETIQSLLALEYPESKLSVIVVDDCSTDDSWQWARKAATESRRVLAIQNPKNMGKRRGINHAVRRATSEIIVSVDSDVIVDTRAVRELVARFTSPKVAAVGGRVHVLNANENWLTRMQAIKYWFGYEYLKNIERWFKSVMCLSGCLTAYRREVLLELEPILEDRRMFGVEIKYGEDRFLTRQIVKAGYQTVNTLDAICWTVAPETLTKYFNQQLRWRRSNIVDLLGGITHAWDLHPVVGIHYLGLFATLFSYPLVVFHAIVRGVFWEGASFHGLILAFLGAVYAFQTRHYAKEARVHPLWFVAMTFVMPVTYLIATPLAIFTLHSSSWETRGHGAHPEAGSGDAPTLGDVLVSAATVVGVSTAPVLAASVRSAHGDDAASAALGLEVELTPAADVIGMTDPSTEEFPTAFWGSRRAPAPECRNPMAGFTQAAASATRKSVMGPSLSVGSAVATTETVGAEKAGTTSRLTHASVRSNCLPDAPHADLVAALPRAA